jgi:hypothetical protein
MRPLPLAAALSLLAALALADPGMAGGRLLPRLDPPLHLLPAASPNCAAGQVGDDGSFEAPQRLDGVGSLDLVMGLDVPPTAAELSQVCLCWTRTGGAATVDFDLLVYDDGGDGGAPGELLAGLGGLRAMGVPLFPQVAFYTFNLQALGIPLPAGRVFVGPSWDVSLQPQAAQCGDENGPSFHPVYFSTDLGSNWEDFGGLAPDLRALGIRTETGQGGGFACVPDDATLCLEQGRFQVRLDWRPQGGGSLVPAHTVPVGSDDSGLFFFVNPANWEMLIKVVNACTLNSRYWVFFAATTNVEYRVTVADSMTGASKQYTNPQGMASPAVTDTEAFATCP